MNFGAMQPRFSKRNRRSRNQRRARCQPWAGPLVLTLFIGVVFGLSSLGLPAASHPSRGLWVGEVILTNVNEVSVAVNAQNVVVAPDPNLPTPTADAAHLRIILHVDANGQVRLLRSVAVINNSTSSVPNIALVTDESLYPNFGGIARRVSAVAFDFGDLKAYAAVTNVAGKVAAAAAAAAANSQVALSNIQSAALMAMTNAVAYAATNTALPSSTGYVAYVASAIFKSAAANAALEAARAAFAVSRTVGVVFQDVANAASSAALKALTAAFTEADTLTLNEVPLSGNLQAGNSVSGTFYLGAYHRNNPFRHRRHPDHTAGYNIIRTIQLEVAPPPAGGSFEPGGYGVDRLRGTYREELHGLHKPLGPDRNIGLKTAGGFVLNRLSLVDTLNH